MKNSRNCPKCSTAEIIRVTGVDGPTGPKKNAIQMSGFSFWNEVRVARYVCLSCGFSEESLPPREPLPKHLHRFFER